ncbi:Excreted virulence factor EspC, type VII ESX diderm [Amycolatopsis marina]|uniref:Excreted virulence factor EspC, type VII ESX diderm n=1 Tax=Amycolatopsis marina TaxID=490629 RepID=A0A1I0V4Q6_9PSEU|nr:type VII secretion target [Amycolatopsis marina]SFA71314.1 Excreted virulence factor EspC, type VII ESX diderm [Amycolatopsis marina]
MRYEVVPEDLVAHASHLDGLVDRLNTAASAARTVSMSDQAYGLLCAFMPMIVNPMEEEASGALDAAVEGVGITADNVRAAAAGYQDADQTHAAPFHAAGADL